MKCATTCFSSSISIPQAYNQLKMGNNKYELCYLKQTSINLIFKHILFKGKYQACVVLWTCYGFLYNKNIMIPKWNQNKAYGFFPPAMISAYTHLIAPTSEFKQDLTPKSLSRLSDFIVSESFGRQKWKTLPCFSSPGTCFYASLLK